MGGAARRRPAQGSGRAQAPLPGAATVLLRGEVLKDEFPE